MLAEYKTKALQLISLNITSPFPKSLYRNRYFMQLINNYTRKNWLILLAIRD